MLKTSEIRDKSIEDLKIELEKGYKLRLYLKGVRALGNAKNVYEYKNAKKFIAQIKTVLNEKKKLIEKDKDESSRKKNKKNLILKGGNNG